MNEENEVVDDLSAALADAWDASEGGDDGITEYEGGHSLSESDSEPGSSSKANATGYGDSASEDVHEGWLRQGETDANAVNQQSEEGEKPPVSLSPEAREVWSDTPEAVRAEFKRMDDRMEGMAKKYGQNAQRAEAMDRALAPFQHLFQLNGGPGQMLPNLLQTAQGLQMGTPQQKAMIAAKIIKDFGVDVKALDSALVGEAPSKQVQAQEQLDQYINQRIAPMQQQLQHYQQRDQIAAQQAQQQVAQEVASFGSQHEFYEDVRKDMADLMDLAANRGREMTMEQAYSIACSQHPTISKILQQRQSTQAVQSKKNAASSIHGTAGGSMGSQPNSIAAALNEAWDSAGRM